MSKGTLTIIILLLSWSSFSQINCDPKIGDIFTPGANELIFRIAPRDNAEVAFRSISRTGMFMECISNEIKNGFINVKIRFIDEVFQRKKVNTLILQLHDRLNEEYDLNISFKAFIDSMRSDENMNSIYNLLKNDPGNDWFNNEYSSESNVSTVDDFKRTWLNFDFDSENFQYIYQNHEREVYVQVQNITNEGYSDWVIPGKPISFYRNRMQEMMKGIDNRDCQQEYSDLVAYTKYYFDMLIDNDKYFELVKEYNSVIKYLKDQEKMALTYYAQLASYEDGNYMGSIEFGSKIIDAYKNGIIKNRTSKYDYEGIRIAEVYGRLISSLINHQNLKSAVAYCEDVLSNDEIRFDLFAEYYSFILFQLDKDSEACNFLNQEYMNGNETAREILLEKCQN